MTPRRGARGGHGAWRGRRRGRQVRAAYVTLKPCSHFGRTPPCATRSFKPHLRAWCLRLRIRNPARGWCRRAAARQACIEVEWAFWPIGGELNAGYLSRMRHGRPWVRIKLAMSLDGRTALPMDLAAGLLERRRALTCKSGRARSSAILTGIGTVLADDPRLDVAARPPTASAAAASSSTVDCVLQRQRGSSARPVPLCSSVLTMNLCAAGARGAGAKVDSLRTPGRIWSKYSSDLQSLRSMKYWSRQGRRLGVQSYRAVLPMSCCST